MDENEKKEYFLHTDDEREIVISFLKSFLKSFFSLSVVTSLQVKLPLEEWKHNCKAMQI